MKIGAGSFDNTAFEENDEDDEEDYGIHYLEENFHFIEPALEKQNSIESPKGQEEEQNSTRQDSAPYLFAAIHAGNLNGVEDLLNQTTEGLNNSTYGGLTPLHAVCHTQNLDIMRLLISKGARTDSLDSLGNTVLHVAVTGKWHAGIEELLHQGACPSTKSEPPDDVNGFMKETPLHTALRMNDNVTVALLLKFQPDLSIRDSKNYTVLHLAASMRKLTILRQFLEEISDTDVLENMVNDSFTLYHAALSKESPVKTEAEVLKIIQIIHRYCKNVNQVNLQGETPLFMACLRGLPTVVKFLVTVGADPTQVTRERKSTLHAACIAGSSATLQHLFATGRVDHLTTCRDNYGYHPFYFAIESASIDCCKILLEKGEHLTNFSHDGVTNCSLVIDNLPSAMQLLEDLFSSSVKVSKKSEHDPAFSITFDYSVLMSSEKGKVQCSIASELADTPLEFLVKHPLVESFLCLKWHGIKGIFYINALAFFLYLLLHTSFVMLTFGAVAENWSQQQGWLKAFQIIHAILIVILFVPGTIVVIANYKQYLKQWETYTRLSTIVCSTLVLILAPATPIAVLEAAIDMPSNSTDNITLSDALNMDIENVTHTEEDEIPLEAGRAIASLSLLFGWVQLMMLLGRFPALGAYVLMFTKVAKAIIKFILAFLSLIIGFSLSFHILFLQMPVFANYQLSFAKTLMMMTGEIAYSEFVNEKKMPFKLFSLVILSVFLFMVTVVMSNLLIGLAVNDIPDLKRQGKIKRLVKEASYLTAYETLTLFTYRVKLFPRKLRQIFTSKCNINSVITIWPNREVKRHKYRQIIPSEIFKEAIALGNRENLEDYLDPIEEEINNQLKEFDMRYSSVRLTQRRNFKDLARKYSTIQRQMDLMQRKMDDVSMQMQQQLQQNQQLLNHLSKINVSDA